MPIIIFFIVIVVLNLAFSKKAKSLTNAAYISGIVSILTSICFQVLAYIFMGYLDPFFLIAFVVQSIIAFVVGFVINALILKFKD